MKFVLVEYPEPVAPHHRRLFILAGGPVEFDCSPEDAADLQRQLGAASPFRVVPIEWAQKAGLYGGR